MQSTTPKPIMLAGRSEERAEIVILRNPYNGQAIEEVCYATANDAVVACAAAERAFAITKKLPSWERSAILARMADTITSGSEAIARVIALEAGKPLKDARAEVGRGIHTFRTAAEEAKRIDGGLQPADWTPGTEGRIALTRRYPIGPILGITPFNFPLNLVAHKLAPAIAAGNPIIIKPAPQTPLTALRLGQIAVEAGWPAEAISVLPCSNQIAALIVQDERIRMLSFTGSAAVGWKLKEMAHRKRVTLELGGNAAVIVCADADVDLAAQRILAGGYTYAGQSCISVQRVYAHASIKYDLIRRIRDGLKSLSVGDPLDESTRLGPMINLAAAERVEAWIHEAAKDGGTIHAGGGRMGTLVEPTLLSDVSPASQLCREEAFAPVVIVNGFDTLDEAIASTNASSYGLQAAIFTRNWASMAKAWAELEVGAVLVDESSAWRADQLPYGGVKNSGVGKEGVRAAIEEMTEPRLLIIAA
ncbi:MAG: aldehyde dehydrogenase family protein [Acidobacteriaceae bacterium]|jgi:glyceraldehyde-3-phosphate dehydrogenase (NADP+)